VFQSGDAVQTPFGKGRVRAVENGGRLVVEIRQRTLVVDVSAARLLDRDTLDGLSGDLAQSSDDGLQRPRGTVRQSNEHRAAAEIDLHGLVVEEALARIDQALNDALVAGAAELRFIHGRSGGRLRGALHRRLREISSVRHFALDPRNQGVTVVVF
jgi:dsDNA-specific endonuclease/ATPase MutS2